MNLCVCVCVLLGRQRALPAVLRGELQPREAEMGVRGSAPQSPLLLRLPSDSQHALPHRWCLAGPQRRRGSPLSARKRLRKTLEVTDE